MAIREAQAAERWSVTLLRAMTRPLTIKTMLRPTCGRKMIVGATFPARFQLRWIPEPTKLTGNKGLGRDGPLDGHSRSMNIVQDGVRDAVMAKGNNPAVMV